MSANRDQQHLQAACDAQLARLRLDVAARGEAAALATYNEAWTMWLCWLHHTKPDVFYKLLDQMPPTGDTQTIFPGSPEYLNLVARAEQILAPKH